MTTNEFNATNEADTAAGTAPESNAVQAADAARARRSESPDSADERGGSHKHGKHGKRDRHGKASKTAKRGDRGGRRDRGRSAEGASLEGAPIEGVQFEGAPFSTGPVGRGPRGGQLGAVPRSGGRGPGRHRGRRHDRGDLRTALLVLIGEQPRHGYELMQEIAERTSGNWQPSPGSVYPALQQLADEGLIAVNEDENGRRVASLTAAGEAFLADHRSDLDAAWASVQAGGRSGRGDVSDNFKGLVLAYRQVRQVGTDAQLRAAANVIDDARRGLYAVLAQAPEEAGGE